MCIVDSAAHTYKKHRSRKIGQNFKHQTVKEFLFPALFFISVKHVIWGGGQLPPPVTALAPSVEAKFDHFGAGPGQPGQ